jgi:hypothetical protein
VAWAVRADVPANIARELDALAGEEPPLLDLRDAPIHAERYVSLLAGRMHSGQSLSPSGGPAFLFPERIAPPVDVADVVVVEDERLLQRHFRGWVAGEIAAGRSPMMAILEDGHPVSICFSARRSHVAAEAGLETAEPFRGRGFGPCVTAAWALAVRASDWIPLYSTAWTNHASLAVARKLALIAYASSWSLSD